MSQKQVLRFIGCQLQKDLYDFHGTLLVKKGTKLTETLINRLVQKNISLEDFQEQIVPVATKTLLDPFQQQLLINSTVGEIRDIFSKVKDNENVLHDVEEKVLPVVEQLSLNYDICTLMNGILNKDDYTYRHNIGVSVLASLLAKWLGLSREEVQLVSMGGLLHDIGKLYISDQILQKQGKLTNEEYKEIKKHPIYGYELLTRTSHFRQEIALMALEHHEREDGKGYPHGKTANRIHYYSKIIAIADIFHAMTSDRVYRDRVALYEVLKEMKSDAFGKLEPRMTYLFIQRIMEMSIGNSVYLSDGTIGQVKFIHSEDPINPVIQVNGELLDLRFSSLYIVAFTEIT